jgi:hypothetical protein
VVGEPWWKDHGAEAFRLFMYSPIPCQTLVFLLAPPFIGRLVR